MEQLPLISYAQNDEDVMLWRVFRDAGIGFYVDVGANSPDEHSVTKLFYQQGWRGINIEPLEPWASQLAESRPEDINIAVCASDTDGDVELLDVAETGLSTSDLSMKEQYAEDFEVSLVTRPCRTLTSILEEHAPEPIHFMKVDVEGMEYSTLAGCDFTRFRPMVVLVESIAPLTFEPNHHDWEPLLVEQGYDYLYFDGLNRFYSAKEHTENIRPHFQTPPNLFDGFVRKMDVDALTSLDEGLHETHIRSQELHARSQELHSKHIELQEVKAQLAAVAAERNILEQELIVTEQQVDDLYQSTSWRVTTPMRWLKDATSQQTRKIKNHRADSIKSRNQPR